MLEFYGIVITHYVSALLNQVWKGRVFPLRKFSRIEGNNTQKKRNITHSREVKNSLFILAGGIINHST